MQFLLNFDGSVPEGTAVKRLKELGIPLVRPVQKPAPMPGMEVVEKEPHQIDGVWWQTWEQVELPKKSAPDVEITEITRWQFARFLTTPPLRDMLLLSEAVTETADPSLFEEFQNYKKSNIHKFDEAISIIFRILSHCTANHEISVESLISIWNESVNFSISI